MQDLTQASYNHLTTWLGRRISLALDNITLTSTHFFHRNSSFFQTCQLDACRLVLQQWSGAMTFCTHLEISRSLGTRSILINMSAASWYPNGARCTWLDDELLIATPALNTGNVRSVSPDILSDSFYAQTPTLCRPSYKLSCSQQWYLWLGNSINSSLHGLLLTTFEGHLRDHFWTVRKCRYCFVILLLTSIF